MLKNLFIKNYALIKQFQLDVEKGFTIITGETGAGKSIILGALGLIEGGRADAQVLLDKNEKCIVEATFTIEELGIQAFFEQHDLDYNHTTIIRREISTAGKSRAFVNDTPVTLTVLKELSQQLIDIHSQHQSITLNNKEYQLSCLDSIAGLSSETQEYGVEYKAYKALLKELEIQVEIEKKLHQDYDYFNFQLQEIEELRLAPNEFSSHKAELKIATHAEEIKVNLLKANHILQEDEHNVIQQLNEAKNALSNAGKFDDNTKELAARIQSCLIEIKDITAENESVLETINYNPERLNWLNERISSIEKVIKKHGLNAEDELEALASKFQQQLNSSESQQELIKKLESDISKKYQNLSKRAVQLSKKRNEKIPFFEKSVTSLLQDLGMPDALFKIKLTALEEINQTGSDDVQFLFSANKGIAPAILAKTASGGELSRIMLAIKSLIAQVKVLPTIIFDEIDTGVSGEVAAKMAQILKTLSQRLQIISITHLPQIASKGKHHWFVYKDNNADRTTSHIKVLTDSERIDEIAKMLSNERTGKAAISNAKELLGFK